MGRRSLPLIIAFVFSIVQLQAQLSGTYSVDAAGGGDYSSISEAADALTNQGMSGPVTLQIEPGTYTQRALFDVPGNEDPSNVLTIAGASGDPLDVTIADNTAGEELPDNYQIKVKGTQGLVIRDIGFELTDFENGNGIVIEDSSAHILIDNIHYLGNRNDPAVYFGITQGDFFNEPAPVDDITVTNSYFFETSFSIENYGFGFGTGDYLITNTNFNNNEFFDADGISLQDGENINIADNIFHGDQFIVKVMDLRAIRGDLLIERNRSWRSDEAHIGSYFGTADNPGIVRNNFFAGSDGIFQISGCQHLLYAHNSIRVNSDGQVGQITGNAATTRVLNNIFVQDDPDGTVFGLIGFIEDTAVVNYNNIYSEGPIAQMIGDMGTVDITTIEEYAEESESNENSISVDPAFEVPDSNLHVNSSLLQAGTPLPEVTTDIDGDPRNTTTPTIGADEIDADIPLASLSVDTLTWSGNPEEGGALAMTWTGANTSNEYFYAPWVDKVYLSADQELSPDDTLLTVNEREDNLPPGAEYTHQKITNLPMFITGQNYLIVNINAEGDVPEDNADNIAVSAPLNIASVPKPDLVVTDINLPAVVESGTDIEVEFEVTNTGAEAAVGQWHDALFTTDSLEQFQQPNFLVAENAIDDDMDNPIGLQPGESYTLTKTFTIPPVGSGYRYFTAVTDFDDNKVETDEDNNFNGYVDSLLVNQTPLADLVVDELTVPNTTFSGEEIPVTVTVRNAGNAETSATELPFNYYYGAVWAPLLFGDWLDYIYLREETFIEGPNDYTELFYDTTDPLLPDSTYTYTEMVEIPGCASGIRYIHLVLDRWDHVVELSDANNFVRTDSIEVVLNPNPDLDPLELQTIDEWASGTTAELQYKVENLGADSVKHERIDKFYIHEIEEFDYYGDVELIGTITVDDTLETDDSQMIEGEVELAVDLEGDYYLTVVVDANSDICEKPFEDNNTITIPVTVVQSPAPDLEASLAQPAANLVAGDEVVIQPMVQNIGDAATLPEEDWIDRLWLVPDTAGAEGMLQEERYRFNPLANGSGYTWDGPFELPLSMNAGEWYFYFKADADSAIWEQLSEENNGFATGSFTVTRDSSRVPDLNVTDLEIPSELISGETFDLTWTVENRSLDTPNSGWIDAVMLVTNQDDTISVATDAHGGTVSTDDTYELTASLYIPPQHYGPYKLVVRADTARTLVEYNLANNTREFPVDITQAEVPDLAPGEPMADAANLQAGQPVVITTQMFNDGDGALGPNDWHNDRVLLSDDELPDDNDLVLGSRLRSGLSIPAGGMMAYQDTFFIPLQWSGTYFVIFVADNNDALYEGSGGNNNNVSVSSSAVTINAPQPVDLEPTSGFVALFEDDISSVSYILRNNGPESFQGEISNHYFLSTDQVWDEDDAYLGEENLTIFPALEPGEEQQFSFFPRYVPVTPGDYYVIQKVDGFVQTYDVDRDNNTKAWGPEFLDNVREIEPDSTYVDDFITSLGPPNHYKVDVPDGFGLAVEMWETDNQVYWLNNDESIYELYVSQERVANRLDFDYSSTESLLNEQSVLVPTGPQRFDYIMADATYVPPHYDPDSLPYTIYNIRAELKDFSVYEVFPSQVGNTHVTTLRIDGFDFQDPQGLDVMLALDGDTAYAHHVFTRGTGRINAYIDMRGYDTGDYELVVRKQAEQQTTVYEEKIPVVPDEVATPNITITAPAVELTRNNAQVNVTLQNTAYVNGYDYAFFFIVEHLEYGSDSVSMEFVGTGQSELWLDEPDRDPNTPGQDGVAKVDGKVMFGMRIPIMHARMNETYTFLVNSQEVGKTRVRAVAFPVQRSYWSVTGDLDYAHTSHFGILYGSALATIPEVAECFAMQKVDCGQVLDADVMEQRLLEQTKAVAERAAASRTFVDDIFGDVDGILSSSTDAGTGILQGPDLETVESIKESKEGVESLYEKAELLDFTREDGEFSEELTDVFSCLEYTEENSTDVLVTDQCIWIADVDLPNGQTKTIRMRKPNCTPDEEESPNPLTDPIDWIRSWDPNQIVGPAGTGDIRLIDDGQTLQYTIYFENKAEATAPASRVRIENPLDTAMRTPTFRITSFGFADTTYSIQPVASLQNTYSLPPSFGDQRLQVTAGVDVLGQRSFWELQTIDPQTLSPVSGPEDGFLLPNDSTGRGEGFVTYEIRLNQPVEAGYEVQNQADIIFDQNEVISTNVWSNTIAGEAVDAVVNELPEFSPPNFEVSWTDPSPPFAETAGLYNVYVSKNDSSWVPWITGVEGKKKGFTGEPGDTYKFAARSHRLDGSLMPFNGEYEAKTTIIEGIPGGVDGSIGVVPNPVDDNATIYYEMENPGKAELHLVDTNGKTVWASTESHGDAGTYIIRFNTKSFAEGIYVLRGFLGDKTSESVKVMVAR